MPTFDSVIYNAAIITVNPDFDIIPDGVIGIKDGRIATVEGRDAKRPLPLSTESIDAQGGVVMPGLVNTHTHLPMTLFRGLADDVPLQTWLNEHIFPAEKKSINPETAYAGALLACAEMLLGGTTCCCDGYFYEDAVARAIAVSGMRAVAGQGVIDFPAPGVPDPRLNIQVASAFVEKWQGAHPAIYPSIFCHSPYTCSSETLKTAKKATRAQDVLFQIHVAETKAERERSLAEHGVTPVKYLENLGILDHQTLLVHNIWVDDEDIE
ncbi:MAG: amidohydrolase family protein, partial [Gammaproteobacteria bacterium]|nr:amidohydrolase family protein [Gammaproteobacteria bacterium]